MDTAIEQRVGQSAVPTHQQTLADAIARRRHAERELVEAKRAVERAASAAKADEQALVRIGDVDQHVAEARATMVRHGKTGPLPPELIREREQRRTAREHLDESNAALALLEAERANAEQRLREATAVASAAALQCLLDEGAALSEGLREAKERAWNLDDQLRGLDFVVTGTVATLPREVRGALLKQLGELFAPLHMQKVEHPPGSPASPIRLEAARWRELHAALMDKVRT